jgi:Ca2+-binding EF-hand superfamily protein
MSNFAKLPVEERVLIEKFLETRQGHEHDKQFLKQVLGDHIDNKVIEEFENIKSEDIQEYVAGLFMRLYKDYMSLPSFVRYKIDDTVRKYDEDGNGELDTNEVQKFLTDLGLEVMDEALTYFIKANDLNQDGKLQLSEIRQFAARLFIEMGYVEQEKATHEEKMKSNDIAYLTSLVQHDDSDIKKLTFQGKNPTNIHVQNLCKALISNTSVLTLDLSKNSSITNDSVHALCKLIEENKTLKRLYLDDTSITKVGSIIISMRKNKKIIDMTVPEAQATDEELDELDELLDRNEFHRWQVWCRSSSPKSSWMGRIRSSRRRPHRSGCWQQQEFEIMAL